MIYDNLKEIADEFDVFLFDAYGVFWEGNGFYAGSREIMAELVANGKIVAVVSNTTALETDIEQTYTKRGLYKNRDYNCMYTSGELLKQQLQQKKITFESCQHPIKYYVIGKPHKNAFVQTIYQQVTNLHEADFVYSGVPFMFTDDVKAYPEYSKQYLPVALDALGNACVWDSLTEKPFEAVVDKAVALGLPLLNANPDFTAREGHPLIEGAEAVFVVRNGMIAEMFRKRGAEVLEFGKPHKNVYDYVFARMQKDGIKIDKRRTCMIGDTVRTDIKGAVNVGIVPVLCVNTGVTANAILNGDTVENLCKNEKIDVKQIWQIKSVGGI